MLFRKCYEVSLGAWPNYVRHAVSGGYDMKKLVLAAVLTAAASNAFAGSLAEPIVEAPVIVEEATSSSAGVLLPLLLLALVAAAVAD